MSLAGEAVLWLLEQSEPEARRTAAEQLHKVPGDEAAPLLVRALADDDWRVRKEAVRAAARFRESEVVVATLVDCLAERDDVGLKNAAASALSELGSDIVETLMARVAFWDADAKKLAAEILGRMPHEKSVEALLAFLEDPDSNVRAQAAESLAIARCLSKPGQILVSERLLAIAKDDVPFVRVAAMEAASRLDADVEWPGIAHFLVDRTLSRYLVRFALRISDPRSCDFIADVLSSKSRGPLLDATLAVAAALASRRADSPFFVALRDALRSRPIEPVAKLSEAGRGSRSEGASLLLLGLVASPDVVAHITRCLAEPELSERAANQPGSCR